MSRTYRKKNEPFWIKNEEEYNKSPWLGRNKTFAAFKACYNGDAMRNWDYGETYPLTRHYRAAVRTCLRKELLAIDSGDIIFPLEKEFEEYWW